MSLSESEDEPFKSSGSEYVPSDHDTPGPSRIGKLYIRNKKSRIVNKVKVIENVDKPQKKGKKRMRNPEKWQRNVTKSRKAKGEVYITTSGRLVPERSIGRKCTCRKKCFSSIGDANIKKILHEFNAIADKHKQDTYLCGLICPQPVARKRKRIESEKDRHVSFKYKAKLLESSHAWLGASTSSIAADSYQYQLQSMWQKCWNTNQSLVHNLRFRERGPLKSWRPETMAEAIFSVLKEGLSLSQAARKYDIPYPTFVLYANRVHNMLGPSADGGSDLRPKGRGRPQRILLGVWPDEHIRGVIRAVVFRDSHQIKDESHMAYPRIHDSVTVQNYQNSSCSNGADPNVSPGAAAAAAVAAVAQGLRQQMCSMVAAAQHQSSAHDTNPVASLVNTLALAGHCGNVSMASNGIPPMSMSHVTSMRSMSSPAGSIQDLRISPSESALESPISSPLGLTVSSSMEPTMNMNIGNNMDVGIGVSGMTYKPTRPFTSPRPENLFQEDIDELVKPMHSSTPRPKDSITPIKMEPLAECRGE